MAPKIDVLGAISHLYLFFRTIKQALIYVCATMVDLAQN